MGYMTYHVNQYDFDALSKSIPLGWRLICVDNEHCIFKDIPSLEKKGLDVDFLHHQLKKHFQKLWIHPKDLIGVGNLFFEYVWKRDKKTKFEDYDEDYFNHVKLKYFGKYSEFNVEKIEKVLRLIEELCEWAE